MLLIVQGQHFLVKHQHLGIACMPKPARVEIVPTKCINLGWSLELPSTIDFMRMNKDWIDIQRAIEIAAFALLNLHQDHKVFQGGINMGSVAYAGATKQSYFINWGYACSFNSTGSRLISPTKYYFMVK